MKLAKKQNVQVFKARLNQEIFYVKKGIKIVVPKDTQISVDMQSMVALVAGDHVYIEPTEFQVIS